MDAQQNKLELIQLLEERALRNKYNYAETLFPSEGRLNRNAYPKHMEFFKAGKNHSERAFIAANRIGKTQAGLYELRCHLTGNYPDWWEGKVFTKPILACAVGVTNTQTTTVIQEGLLGARTDIGAGMVEKKCIGRHLSNPGSPDALVSCEVKHSSGGWSRVMFKSQQHDVESFQGFKFDVVFLDEEPPENIYAELLVRTMTTHGIIMLTFTPLQGLSNVILSFLPGGVFPKDQVL